ncbi:MAG TPA: histidine kinase [Actinomycetota bacterium]
MATTVKAGTAPHVDVGSDRRRGSFALGAALAVAGIGLSGAALVAQVVRGAGQGLILLAATALVWAAAGTIRTFRFRGESLGAILGGGAAVAGIGLLNGDLGPAAAGLLPAVGAHLLLSMPDGRLATTTRRVVAGLAYVGAGAAALAMAGGSVNTPLVAGEVAVALLVGAPGFADRFGRVTPNEQRHMKWFALGTLTAAWGAVAVGILWALVDWPPSAGLWAVGWTVAVPVALLLEAAPGIAVSIDALFAHAVSLAGLSAIVAGIYVAVVVGLGRVPRHDERTLLVLSMVAAAVAALLYVPARGRLRRLASRLAYGGRPTSEDVLRSFGTRMSRSVPLDELLLQMVESVRSAFALRAAEMWTAMGGKLELSASDPEGRRRPIALGQTEETTVSRAGLCGPAWARLWLPGVLEGREDAVLRLAPVTHSGELLGLLVAERAPEGQPFDDEEDRVLAELSRQVGLAMHNVRLDSALQSSLDEVRRQAGELQASRGRIVAVANQERRRIERNLHDGAQQHLVAIAVKLRLARQLSERDPAKSSELMEELGGDIEEAVQQLRTLAHGIYPPLLADRGLAPALESAARRAALPVEVRSEDVGRHSAEVEATVYFCCLEAMQNAGKYAGEGASVVVRVWEEAGALLFEASDDGAGFDVTARRDGVGFTNMNDRLGAVGGTLRVESTPGRGTRVRGTIPLAS